MPYRGSWEQTRNTNRVTAVYRTFSLKGIFLSAGCTSGRMFMKGRTRLSCDGLMVVEKQQGGKRRVSNGQGLNVYTKYWIHQMRCLLRAVATAGAGQRTEDGR
jgi:hypothetical protein